MKKVATPVDASGAASVFSLPIALRLSTFLLLALALILGAGAGASFAAGEGDEEDITTAVPRAVVERTVTDVIAALEIPELKSEQRLERIEELVFNVFDFRTMGKLVLARNWKNSRNISRAIMAIDSSDTGRRAWMSLGRGSRSAAM